MPVQVAGLGGVELLLVALVVVGIASVVLIAAVLLGRGVRVSVPEPLDETRRRDLDDRVALDDRRLEVERREHRLAEREQRLDSELVALEARSATVGDLERERRASLEQLAGITVEAARDLVVAGVEHDARRRGALRAREIERAAEEDAEGIARGILATALQRLATDQTSETVVTTVQLPADDVKGRVIGREGRNIRSFEQVTGVNLVIDDTPGAVLLSCFDPIRREVARRTLEELVTDGRIQPTRIEEVHARMVAEVDRFCQRAGEDACLEVGISDLHPRLVATLGRLRFRTSYGQNVLGHLVESGHAAGLLADELGVDRVLCVRAAFLHDIGKALSHEVEGSHARVGADLARAHGEHPDVVHAIEAHHNEVEPRTVEAVLTQAADAMSGGRPGARRESLEVYAERLRRLEEIALANPGVEKAFAMQAGREVRVMVAPEVVDDPEAQVLVRAIAAQVEAELTYPGQITVTVIRESRATEIAR